MFHFKKLILLLLLFSWEAYCQETFSGSFKLTDSISGFATYVYDGAKNQPEFIGDFSFEYALKEDTIVNHLVYKGAFSENKKEGPWNFSRKNLVFGDTIHVNNYEISYPATGFEHKTEANFKDGKAVGKWSVIEQTFKNAKPSDTLFSSQVLFEDARMLDELKAKSKDLSLKANFNEKGEADGKWVIEHRINQQKVEEIRVYKNGVFKEHYFELDNKQYSIEHLGIDKTQDSDEDNWVEIDVLATYFNIFELSNFGFDNDVDISELENIKKVTQRTNQFLEKAIASFLYYEDFEIWNKITDHQIIEPAKFKVRKFDYSKDEEEKLEAIEKYNQEINDLIDGFFSNSQIEIGKLSFESLNKYYQIFEVYREKKKTLQQITQKITHPALVYFEREKFMRSFAPSFKFPNQVNYSFNDESFSATHNFPKVPKQNEFNINLAHQFFKEIKNNLKVLDKEVKEILGDLKKQEEISELEEELFEKRNEIQILFSDENTDKNKNEFHKKLYETAQDFAETKFKAYVNTPLNEKKEVIDYYLECFDEVLKLYDFLADYQRKVNRIENEYTRVTFNPQLMVEMEERVKERLYEAYEKYALPYLFENLANNFECNQIEGAGKNLEMLYNKMIRLREEDTKSIEKSLKRQKDPNEILSILEIEVN
ncbi:hypothetical protein [Psychroflexus maritimus]|uniref:MORN repeat variant n=1 Tax=Psychroflexus maritimus TaxID=2714865 RepID=A0A967E224_9FLAO|nr:hypothetical protein [Psychroflexus maritimus]NGZ89359.1 hypothetical protein [Psychroflexus maritimus]